MPYTFKKKRGYTLKKGKSGEMRWHKDPASGSGNSVRRLSPKEFPKRLEAGPLARRGVSARQRSTRFEPNPGAVREMTELDRAQKDLQTARDYSEVDRLMQASDILGVNDPVLKSDNTLYLPGTVDSSGFEYSLGTGHYIYNGTRNRIFSALDKDERIRSAKGVLKKAVAMYSDNVDKGVTPNLPSFSDIVYNAKNKSVINTFIEGMDDGLDNQFSAPKMENEYLDRSVMLELQQFGLERDIFNHPVYNTYELTANKVLKGEEDWYTLENHRDFQYGVNSRTSPFNLKHQKYLAVKELAEALDNAGVYYDADVNMSGYLFKTHLIPSPDQIRQVEFDKVINQRAERMREAARSQKNGEIATALNKVRRIIKLERKQAADAGKAARVFSKVAALNRIDRFKIEPTSDRPEVIESVEKIKNHIDMIYSRYNNLDVSGDVEGYHTQYEDGGLTPSFPTDRIHNSFVSYTGRALANPNPGDYVSVNTEVFGSHQSISLHELIHGFDYADNGVLDIFSGTFNRGTNRLSGNTDWFIQEGVPNYPHNTNIVNDLNEQVRLGKDLGRITYDSTEAKSVHTAKQMIIRDLYRVSSEYLKRDLDADKVKEPLSSGRYGSKVHRGAFSDRVLSPFFTLPEQGRFQYIFETGENSSRSVRDFLGGFKAEKSVGKFDASHPELITVMTEYALGAPHILQAIDEIHGTTLRKHINRFYGMSVCKKSDPVLLANAKINLIAMKNAQPETALKNAAMLTAAQVSKKRKSTLAFQLKYGPDLSIVDKKLGSMAPKVIED